MRTRFTRHGVAAALAALLLALAVSACGSSSSSGGSGGSGQETKVIRYQDLPGSVLLPQLADALGYLPGLTLKDVGTVQGGPQSLQALVTNQTDIGAAFNGAIAQLASTGAKIKGVIEWLGSSGDVSTGIWVLKKSPIHTAQQLIGKKVAVNTLGANAEAILDLYLEKSGLTKSQISQVTLVPLPTVDSEAALESGKVDAAWLSTGPALAYAGKQGGLRALANDIKMIGPYNAASIAMNDSFIKQNPKTTKEFVAGMAKAMIYSQTHPIADTRKIMQAWLHKVGLGTEASALDAWNGTGVATHGGYIRPRDFSIWTNWLESRGNTAVGKLNVNTLFTNEFNPYAPSGT